MVVYCIKLYVHKIVVGGLAERHFLKVEGDASGSHLWHRARSGFVLGTSENQLRATHRSCQIRTGRWALLSPPLTVLVRSEVVGGPAGDHY